MDNSLSERTTSSHHDANSRLMLVGVAGIVLLILAATLIARLTGFTPNSIPDTVVIETREIGFRDLPTGSVVVYEWNGEHELLELKTGEGSFLRGVVRSLVRQRAGMGDNLSAPFLLSRHSDGRLVIEDSATGEKIDLVAFGPSNSVVFATLLDTPIPATTEGTDG